MNEIAAPLPDTVVDLSRHRRLHPRPVEEVPSPPRPWPPERAARILTGDQPA